jgi:hypothetical protein
VITNFSYSIKTQKDLFLSKNPERIYTRNEVLSNFQAKLEKNRSFYDPLSDDYFHETKFGVHFTRDGGNENSFMLSKLEVGEMQDILFVRSSLDL